MFEGGDRMSGGFSGTGPDDSGDELARLLAADEAAISDDGFSARVMSQARVTRRNRNVALYGAGMIGFGVAAGSISEAASRSPWLKAWVAEMDAFLAAPQLPSVLDSGPAGIVVIAMLAGITCSFVAFAAQPR